MLHKIIPSSLFVRFILIIALPIIFAQLIATYIFYNRHWESVSKNMSLSLSNEIQTVFEIEKQKIDPNERYKIYNKLAITFDVRSYRDNKKIIDSYPSEAEFLYNHLKASFSLPIKIRFSKDNNNIIIDIFKNDQI